MEWLTLLGTIFCFTLGLNAAVYGMDQQQKFENNAHAPMQLPNAPAYIQQHFDDEATSDSHMYPEIKAVHNSAQESLQTPPQNQAIQQNKQLNIEHFEISSSPSLFEWISIETYARTHGYSATYTPYLVSKTLVTMAQKHFNLSNNVLDQLILQKKLSEIADRVVRDDAKKAINLNAQCGIELLKDSLERINANNITLGNRAQELIKTTVFCLQKTEYENIQAFQSLASWGKEDSSANKEPKKLSITIQKPQNEEFLARKQLTIQFSNTLNIQPSSFYITVPVSFETKKQDQGWFNTGFVSKIYRKVQEKLNGYADSYREAIDNGILDKSLKISEYCEKDLDDIKNIIDYLGELITIEHVASNVVNDLAQKIFQSCLHNQKNQEKDVIQKELIHVNNLQRCLTACKNQNYPISPIVAKILSHTIQTIHEKKQIQASSFNEMNTYISSIIKNSENPIQIIQSKHQAKVTAIPTSIMHSQEQEQINSMLKQHEQQQEQ